MAPRGFQGRPGTKAYRVSRSSFAPGGCATVSSQHRAPTRSESSTSRIPIDPLSPLEAECPTPAFISGEQDACSPAPSSPKKCSEAKTSDQDRRLRPAAARRLLELKLGTAIPRATFYRWMQSGILPTEKLVGRYLITTRALTRFAEEARW
jgi:hypothetical protein